MRLQQQYPVTEAVEPVEEPALRVDAPPLALPPALLPDPADVRELPSENSTIEPAPPGSEVPRNKLDEFVVPGDSTDEEPHPPHNVIPPLPRNVIPPLPTPRDDGPAPAAERSSSRRGWGTKPEQQPPQPVVAEQQHAPRTVAIRWKIIAE
jgi:hypothetical protein